MKYFVILIASLLVGCGSTTGPSVDPCREINLYPAAEYADVADSVTVRYCLEVYTYRLPHIVINTKKEQ